MFLTNSLFGQVNKNDKKMLQKVVLTNAIGKSTTYFENDKEYGKLEYEFKYLGLIKTDKNIKYKIVTRTLFSGLSHHATNHIYVFNDKNKLVGFYHVVLLTELPIKIKDNYLIFFDNDSKTADKIYCGKGLPSKIYGRTLECD
jgi:hypothetical protein